MIISNKFYYTLIAIPGIYALLIAITTLGILYYYSRIVNNPTHMGALAIYKYVFGILWREAFMRLIMIGYFIQQAISQSTFPPIQPHLGSNISRFVSSMIVLTAVLVTNITGHGYLKRNNDEMAEKYEMDVREGVIKVLGK